MTRSKSSVQAAEIGRRTRPRLRHVASEETQLAGPRNLRRPARSALEAARGVTPVTSKATSNPAILISAIADVGQHLTEVILHPVVAAPPLVNLMMACLV